MTRTELHALADWHDAEAANRNLHECSDARERHSQTAYFLRQIAEAQPAAARYGWDGDGWLYLDNGSGSDWMTRHADAEPLYTLPLED